MSFINSVDEYGDELLLQKIMEDTLIDYRDEYITDVLGGSAFRRSQSLETVEMPNLKGYQMSNNNKVVYFSYWFADCPNLRSVSFPNAEKLCSNCFQNDTALVDIYLPNLETVPRECFAGTNITSISLPSCSSFWDKCFPKTLKSIVYDENASSYDVGAEVFAGTDIVFSTSFFEKLVQIGSGAFDLCYGVPFNITTPQPSLGYYSGKSFVGVGYIWHNNATSIQTYNSGIPLETSTFETVYFPNIQNFDACLGIRNQFFLKKIVLGTSESESVIPLSHSIGESSANLNGGFYNTLFLTSKHGEYGNIYVADSLVNEYKEATNWSILADRIKPLSEFSETFANDPSYIQDSWATIKQNIDNDDYSQYLNKKKLLLVPGYGWCYMVCIKQDGDELADGTGNAKTTWFCEDGIGIKRRMNPSMVSGTVGTGSIGGYANSEIKGVMDDIYEVLNAEDSELHNIITPVKKYTHVYNVDGTGSSTRNHDVESTEYVWLASDREMFGTSSTTYETKGVTYSDYFTDNASRIKYIYSGAIYWWLRSSNTSDYYFRMVSSSGGSSYSDANGTIGVAFGFCI